MTFLKKDKQDHGSLMLEGRLTLEHIRKMHEELSVSLENVQHLDVDLSGVTEMDLAFLQLLCSAHRTATTMKKTLSLTENIPEVFRQAIEDNGYPRQCGCSLDVSGTCLWVKR